ncbi:MAG: PrsW family intramembrane metalloprotease [Deltaproteobacteria bacterium]|nr:PrsW family intramembrane metalloprotease [Deltaproteobacteria bacterium]
MSRVRTLVGTELLLGAGLIGLVLVAVIVERIFDLRVPVWLSPLVAAGLAGIPALLWLGFFYLQDRHEPEPKSYILGMFLLGALVSGPVAGFFLDMVHQPHSHRGIHGPSPEQVVGSLAIIAVVQELVKYLLVRSTIYLSKEFDEPMDGIMYMSAVGIGFATEENYRYLQGVQGSVFLATGIGNVVITTLAHACFAAVLGYSLGRAKFSKASRWAREGSILGGLLVATCLNAIFGFLERSVKAFGLADEPWGGLALATAFAAIVFVAISNLMSRQRLHLPSPNV